MAEHIVESNTLSLSSILLKMGSKAEKGCEDIREAILLMI